MRRSRVIHSVRHTEHTALVALLPPNTDSMFATMTGHWLQARNHKPAAEVKKQRNSSPGELYDLPRGGFSEEDREEEKQGDFKIRSK